jgi:hypothetical protein
MTSLTQVITRDFIGRRGPVRLLMFRTGAVCNTDCVDALVEVYADA